MFGLTYSICIAWLPTYFNDQFQLDVKSSSFLSVLPWMAMAVGTNASGFVADALIHKKVTGDSLCGQEDLGVWCRC